MPISETSIFDVGADPSAFDAALRAKVADDAPAKRRRSSEARLDTDAGQVQDAVGRWNAMAEGAGLSQVQRMTDGRRTKLLRRVRDAGGLEGWQIAVEKVAGSQFLTGQSSAAFKASFDWLIEERNFIKVMEGNYADSPARAGSSRSKAKPQAETAQGRAARLKMEMGLSAD